MSHHEPNRWKGYILGMAGSAAGVLAMKYYWQAATALTGSDPRSIPNNSDFHPFDSVSVIGTHHQEDESSTAALGRIIYSTLAGQEPAKETKTTLSYIVHWGYGMAQGGLYGAARAGAGFPDLRGGLVFGTALWLLGDEALISTLGLAAGPTKYAPAEHLNRWAAHLTYGLTTALTTQLLYRVL